MKLKFKNVEKLMFRGWNCLFENLSFWFKYTLLKRIEMKIMTIQKHFNIDSIIIKICLLTNFHYRIFTKESELKIKNVKFVSLFPTEGWL
jgi:hypothetical protein